jgi:AraC-like DNA-binding protein
MATIGANAKAGLPGNTRLVGGRLGVGSPPVAASAETEGFFVSLVSHASMEIEIPPQTAHRISIAIGRRPGVWTDILGRRTVADLGHLHANIVPAAHGTWVDDPTPGQFLFLRLESELSGSWLGDQGRRFAPRPAFNQNDTVIARFARALVAHLASGRAPDTLMLDAAATRIAQRLAHLAGQPTALPVRFGFAPWELRRIEEFIEASLSQPFDLDALARLVDRPRLHLLQGFVATFGMQPGPYVTAFRLRRARMLLEAGRIPLALVARHCSFESIDALDRAFRDVLGIDLATYRHLRG